MSIFLLALSSSCTLLAGCIQGPHPSVIQAAMRPLSSGGRLAGRSEYARFEYQLPRQTCGPSAIVLGSDNAFWFTETRLCAAIGRIDFRGRVREFPVGSLDMRLSPSIVLGSDGALWFAAGNSVGRITTKGDVRAFEVKPAFVVTALTVGPDHAMWFSGFSGPRGGVGQINIDGARMVFLTPGRARQLITGQDHALWFTQDSPPAIWRLAADGSQKRYSMDGAPDDIAAGPNGSTWFIEQLSTGDVGHIGKLSRSGKVALYPALSGALEPDYVSQPQWISQGPGGIWYGTGSLIGRISAEGTSTFYSPTSPNSKPSSFAVGPDGDLWFTEYNANAIGRIKLTP